MRNIPKKIYLQIGDDAEIAEDFKDLAEVSWCEDKIFDTDIEYTCSNGWISEARKVVNLLPENKVAEFVSCLEILEKQR